MAYIFQAELLNALYNVLVDNSEISVTPCDPPFIEMTKGRHTMKIKLGKFLSKYINNQEEVKKLVEGYKYINSSFDEYVVKYSTDYEEIYRIPLYIMGTSKKSCMVGSDSVRVYRHDPRLSLLLIFMNGDLAARTLVRSDTKEYIRLYVDHNLITPDVSRAIVELREGYKPGTLQGITLERIRNSTALAFVCPYLDGIQLVRDEKTHLTITEYGTIDASNITGHTSRCFIPQRKVRRIAIGGLVINKDRSYQSEYCAYCGAIITQYVDASATHIFSPVCVECATNVHS